MCDSQTQQTFSDIGEKRFLQLIQAYLAREDAELIVGVGDDAAVISWESAQVTVLTVDALVEGNHFPHRPRVDWFRLGRKSIAANLSDVAAMACLPRYVLVSLGVPADLMVSEGLDLYRGMHSIASQYGVGIIGGDTVRSPLVMISVTVVGYKKDSGKLGRRSLCRPNEFVYLSGHVGASRAGLEILLDPKKGAGLSQGALHSLLGKHLDPVPRVELGLALGSILPNDFGMIDISDSLFNELSLMASASRVGFQICVDAIPRSQELLEYAKLANESALDYALFSGEEYELLFTTSLAPNDLEVALEREGIRVPVTAIGRVTPEAGKIEWRDSEGRVLNFSDRTYNHFRGPHE